MNILIEKLEDGILVKDGKPVVFYHGTNSEFEFFDKSFLGSAKNGEVYGDSFNFTAYKSRAEDFGKYIVKAFLKVKNPLVMGTNEYLVDGKELNSYTDLSTRPVMLKILRRLWIGDMNNSSQDDYLISKLKSPAGFVDLLKGIAHRDKTHLSDLIKKFGFDSIVDGHIVAVFYPEQIQIIGRENSEKVTYESLREVYVRILKESIK